jgi:hypothetical protein
MQMGKLYVEAGRLIAFRRDDGALVGSKLERRWKKDRTKQWRWVIGTRGPRGGFKPIARGKWEPLIQVVRSDCEGRLRDMCKESNTEIENDF